jgi:response regulator RpfG family c-di-GMP phosphodiesterase
VNRNVLLVDDQPPVLEALRRQLSRKATVDTASSGDEGLQLIQRSGPYAVVISDMHMPRMNGAAFLERVREASPDSVRMILTGQAELESAIGAVNFGHIFRFLRKPCKSEELMAALASGVEQYELVTARKELLEQTLHGIVQVLVEILGLTNPLAQKRASRIARNAENICKTLAVPVPWQLQIALMLSQIGCISLPEEILSKIQAGHALSEESLSIYKSHPALAGKLLGGIPRLEPVARIIAHQLSSPDLSAQPDDLREWDAATFGAMILKLAADLDDILGTGVSLEKGAKMLVKASPGLPQGVLQAVTRLQPGIARAEQTLVKVSQLRVGMVLDEDVMSATGLRLVPKGQEITRSIMLRLQSFAEGVGVAQPFRVTCEK